MTHYTLQRWQAYTLGDELDRALMDTHLLECDACTDLYVAAVEELHESLPQLSHLSDFSDRVVEQINLLTSKNILNKQPLYIKRWYTNMFVHYTIAASLTIILVGSGIFDQMFKRVSQISEHTEQAQKTTVSDQLTNKAGKWLDSIPVKHMKKEGKP